MKVKAGWLVGILALLASVQAEARGRYTRGRTLFRRVCGVCTSMGWQWAPSASEAAKANLGKMAKKLSSARICTWMRKPARTLRGKGCYAGRMSHRQKLDVLYYLKRRALSKFKKPVLRRLSPRFAKRKIRFKKKAPAMLEKARKRHRNRLELKKLKRNITGRAKWTGSLKPAKVRRKRDSKTSTRRR